MTVCVGSCPVLGPRFWTVRLGWAVNKVILGDATGAKYYKYRSAIVVWTIPGIVGWGLLHRT